MTTTADSWARQDAEKSKVRASVLHGAKDLRIEQRHLSEPGPLELQISLRATGLCGSDLHYYKHHRNGDIIVKEPLSLGHESAGVVVAIGSEVLNFSIGDKVALEVGVPCEECERCTEGRYNICKEMRFRSSAKSFPHYQGTLQDRINHPSAWCHKLPDRVSLDLGAILEPLSVAIHANRRAALPRNSTALVLGAGSVGLLVAAVARMEGARDVVIGDINGGRVRFAVENRFAHLEYVVPIRQEKSIEENLERAREVAAAIGQLRRADGSAIGQVDAVFECTGVPSCVQAAIYASRAGGKVMLVGMGTPIQTLPLAAAALREVDLCGVFRYANTYPRAIEIVSDRSAEAPDFSTLITHRFKGMENIEEAFNLAERTKDEDGGLVLKVLIQMEEEEKTNL